MSSTVPAFVALTGPDEPIRAEIFSSTARSTPRASPGAGRAQARAASRWPIRAQNARVLVRSYRAIKRAITQLPITPAAEGSRQLSHRRRADPRIATTFAAYYRQLPKLAPGIERLPRVYGVGWAFVRAHDSRVDPRCPAFVAAYQGPAAHDRELCAVASPCASCWSKLPAAETIGSIARRSREQSDALAERCSSMPPRTSRPRRCCGCSSRPALDRSRCSSSIAARSRSKGRPISSGSTGARCAGHPSARSARGHQHRARRARPFALSRAAVMSG